MVPVAASLSMVPPAFAAVVVVLATAPTTPAAPLTMLMQPVQKMRSRTMTGMDIQPCILLSLSLSTLAQPRIVRKTPYTFPASKPHGVIE